MQKRSLPTRLTLGRSKSPTSSGRKSLSSLDIVRVKVRKLVGVQPGRLERLERKAKAYYDARIKKNKGYTPATQSWGLLKDPVYLGIVSRIEQLNNALKSEFYESFEPKKIKKASNTSFELGIKNPEKLSIDALQKKLLTPKRLYHF